MLSLGGVAAPAARPARARAQQRQPQVSCRSPAQGARARHEIEPLSLSRRRGANLVAKVGSVEPAPVAEAPSGNTLAPAKIWEVDFCSRPLLDDRGKKVWELLITDADRKLQYSEFFPNNKINSQELAKAIRKVAEAPGMVMPEKIRFFRGQMQTIITRACGEVGVEPVPSRRCIALMNLLEKRYKDVYPTLAGFDPNAPPLMGFEPGAPQARQSLTSAALEFCVKSADTTSHAPTPLDPSPQPLPDALRGEQWAFVQLPLESVLEEAKQVRAQRCFGAVFDEAVVGEGLDPLSVIPGVVVFSQRAAALAGWTNGLELAGLSVDTRTGSLILETGVTQRWQYASYRKAAQTTQEAEEWMAAKGTVGGLHFLAIQTDAEAETCTGFWMLRDTSKNI